jgi:hypothetical protein
LVCITTSAKTVTQPTIKIRFIESPHPNQHSHTQFSARGLVQKGHTVQLIGWLLTRMDGLQERQPPGLSRRASSLVMILVAARRHSSCSSYTYANTRPFRSFTMKHVSLMVFDGTGFRKGTGRTHFLTVVEWIGCGSILRSFSSSGSLGLWPHMRRAVRHGYWPPGLTDKHECNFLASTALFGRHCAERSCSIVVVFFHFGSPAKQKGV